MRDTLSRAIATRYARHSDAQLRATVRGYAQVRHWWMLGRMAVTAWRVAKLELRRRGITLNVGG